MSFVNQIENGKKYANKTLSMAKIALLRYVENNLYYIL